MTIIENNVESLFYCQNCDSDSFTIDQKCSNFNQTLEQFHVLQGHVVIPFVKRQSITELFTQAWKNFLPKNISELKQTLKNSIDDYIDKTKTIDSDSKEFHKDTRRILRI